MRKLHESLVDRLYQEEAQEPGEPQIDWRTLKAQGRVESALDADAISSAGAMGIAQFMPTTWRWLWRDILGYKTALPSPFDEVDSISAQNQYMRLLLHIFGGDLRLALAAYHAGPGTVRGVVNQYGTRWFEHLGPKTRDYVHDVEFAIAEEEAKT